MFTKGTTLALFAIAMISSLVVLSGFIGSAYAYAAKKVKQDDYSMTLPVPFSGLTSLPGKDKSISQTLHGFSTGHSGWTVDISDSIPAEEMNMLREECNT
jgi:hypothetical protein